MSADGRYVVFEATDPSPSAAFVPGDTNGLADLFLRDRRLKKATLLTKPPSGGQTNAWSSGGLITRDGKTVIFTSATSNLASGTVLGRQEILKLDLGSHRFERIQLASGTTVPDAPPTMLSISGVAGSWPSRPRPPIWCRTTPMASATSLFGTGCAAARRSCSTGRSGT